MNTIIKLRCIDQVLICESAPTVTSGGKNEDVIRFTFCDLWAGMAKIAVFWHDKRPKEVYHALISIDGECVVPHEVLSVAGRFFVGVMGVKDDTRRTTTTLAFNVAPGVEKKGIASAPTKTIYEQLLASYATCTEMMESIVANAEAVAETAEKAAADAEAAAAKAETAAEDAAQNAAKEAMDSAAETINVAVIAAQDARRAAENAVGAAAASADAASAAAAAAKDDVLAMGCVRCIEGTYTGSPTENQGAPSRAVELSCTPKFIFIVESEYAGTFRYTRPYVIFQGQTLTSANNIEDSDGDITVYDVYAKLDGSTLKFTCEAYNGRYYADDATVTNDFLNAKSKTYRYIAFY